MVKIRRDDTVVVMIGKDRGKKGKVLRILEDRVVVEGINTAKKHVRPTQDNPQGGFTTVERPVSTANLRRLCGRCNRGVRVGFSIAKDGTKQRVCKRCGEAL